MNQEQKRDSFQQTCGVGLTVFNAKQEEYGDAIDSTGLWGAAVELVGGAARLQNLVQKAMHNPQLHHEVKWKLAVEDTLMDLHNYANIGIIAVEQENWHGK